jgi:hypothetical protein
MFLQFQECNLSYESAWERKITSDAQVFQATAEA